MESLIERPERCARSAASGRMSSSRAARCCVACSTLLRRRPRVGARAKKNARRVEHTPTRRKVSQARRHEVRAVVLDTRLAGRGRLLRNQRGAPSSTICSRAASTARMWRSGTAAHGGQWIPGVEQDITLSMKRAIWSGSSISSTSSHSWSTGSTYGASSAMIRSSCSLV